MHTITISTRQVISLLASLKEDIVRLENLSQSDAFRECESTRDFLRDMANDLRCVVEQAERA